MFVFDYPVPSVKSWGGCTIAATQTPLSGSGHTPCLEGGQGEARKSKEYPKTLQLLRGKGIHIPLHHHL